MRRPDPRRTFLGGADPAPGHAAHAPVGAPDAGARVAPVDLRERSAEG